MKIRTVSGNQVFLLPSDAILKVSAVVACTVQLGASRDYAGYFTIKKTESSANAVTIVPASGEKIDGADSVTLTTENEYKTLAPAEGGWTVVDSYTATPSLASPVLTTPLIADGDDNVTITSADQTHATPVVTIPDIGDAADEFVMKDTAQTLTNKTLNTPTLILQERAATLNAVAAAVTVEKVVIDELVAGDTVSFDSNAFAMVASNPGATEFTNLAGLVALVDALEAWEAAADTGAMDITAAVKGAAGNGEIVTVSHTAATTAGGIDESAKAACDVLSGEIGAMAAGDTIAFDGSTFTKVASDAGEGEFTDTAGLITLLDALEDWVASASGSDVHIESAANGAAYNDRTVVITYKRTTASGEDGVAAAKGTVVFDATHIYICTGEQTVTDAYWKSAALS